MRKQIPIIFASTLFLCGLMAGLIARSESHAQQPSVAKVTNDPLHTGGLASAISTDVVCLMYLRAGDTNAAISLLERITDGNMVVLAEGLSLLPSSERDPQQLQVIKNFREYRRQFPLTNSMTYFHSGIPTYVKDGMARAYSLVPEQNGGR